MPLNKLTETGEVLGVDTSPLRDLQTSTFSLDIARSFCNTWVELNAAATNGGGVDVIVVGSGMYGAYFAACLYEFGKALGPAAPRIVVLESGPFLLGEHFQNLTSVGFVKELVDLPLVGPAQQQVVEDNGTRTNKGSISPHARCVGGKSLFWGGWAPRMNEADLRAANSPWPKEVVDYLYQSELAASEIDDGYPFIEEEIGVSERSDFVQGLMQQTLLQKAAQIVAQVKLNGNNDTKLGAPEDAPIAVQAKTPVSGVFSFDKFSSLPRLLDALRDDIGRANGNDANRRLLLVPNTNVLRVVVDRGVALGVQVVVVDLPASGVPKDPNSPRVGRSIEFLRMNPGGIVVLAGNTINSTRVALNSFPRPDALGPELMGRNLMVHVRSNHVWQVKRSALGLPENQQLGNTALHVPGRSRTIANVQRQGRFHFQFYASANVPEGASSGPEDAEAYLYRLLPNFDQVQDILKAHDSKTVALGIRTCGETFGDRTAAIPHNNKQSWMDVSPPGVADEIFVNRQGQELARAPRAFVKLAENNDDANVRSDQTAAAFQFIAKLTGANEAETGARIDYNTFINGPSKVRYISESDDEQDGIGTTYHECGTLWMGADPATSVTDVHGRFHHVANVCCVDQALFPTSDSANPVPTGLALARKVARGIVDRFAVTSEPAIEAGFRSLYDGTFQKWTIADANNFFAINNSTIGAGVEGDSSALGVLWHEEQFTDFQLRLQFRTFSPVANGGVFVRAPKPNNNLSAPGGFYASALEVQIDERGFSPDTNTYGSPLHRTGAVYNRLPSTRWAARRPVLRGRERDHWNDLSIICRANAITVILNEQVVSSGVHGGLARGHIGLQCHTEVVQYRAIRIKE